ncbi:MAG: CBS domain-containing protein [Planctomycetaceae bacterium]|nr:CBS domain-containing protein [Planctomycetaceae bacterium]
MIPFEELPRASQFMHSAVHTVTPNMSLAEVIDFLLKHKVSNAPVVEASADGVKLVGFISERDCLMVLSNESFFGNPAPHHTAGSIMRKHPICVSPETELFALASIFVSHDYRHLPVTEQGRLAGIVSRRDVLKAVHEYYAKVTDENRRRSLVPDPKLVTSHRFVVARSD